MAARIRGIDDCIKALEDASDRLRTGSLNVADATAVLRTAEGSAKLVGLKAQVLKLELYLADEGEERFLEQELFDLEDGMKRFRATLRRVVGQIVQTELRTRKPR